MGYPRHRECLSYDGSQFAAMCEQIDAYYRERSPLIIYNTHGELFFHTELLQRTRICADALPIWMHREVLPEGPRIQVNEGLLDQLGPAVRGMDVLFLDDRAITGSTIAYLEEQMILKGARDFKAAVLLDVHATRAEIDVALGPASGFDGTAMLGALDCDVEKSVKPFFVGVKVALHTMN